MARFLDFIGVLMAFRRQGAFPASLPQVRDLAAWCNEEPTRLVSWRDGTTRLLRTQLDSLRTSAIAPSKDGIYPSLPLSMFICTHLWDRLVVHNEDGTTTLYEIRASYERSWRLNRNRLVAAGLRFGVMAWPDYLVDGPAAVTASGCSADCFGNGSWFGSSFFIKFSKRLVNC